MMNNHKLNILFVIRGDRTRRDGKVPLQCRLTYKTKRKQFATGLFINPSQWVSNKQEAFLLDEHKYFNSQVSLIRQKLNQAFLILQVKDEDFNANDIYNQFLGKKAAIDKTLIDAFDYHTERMSKLVGIEVTQTSVGKYYQTLKHVKTYLMFKYKKRDYLLKDLKLNFLIDFEYYLKTEKGFKPNTVYKTAQRLRRVVRVAVGINYILKDPFLLHKANKPKVKVVFLSSEELKILESYQFTQLRLQEVKDWFIFSCYTGLAYSEFKGLEKKHIVKGFDGVMWIEMIRKKTQKNIAIPILPIAKGLIYKYINDDSEFIFDVCSNQRYNSYLKEIASIVGIDKRLTTHTARKTFASTVLLYNDVPMEIVSQLLGHSSITTTEGSYGKVVQKKVSEQMKKLNKKLTS